MGNNQRSIALALGGGGVKGLAHIPLLKKLDDLGVKPQVISGTSMGAILGALYAAGVSGEEIEKRVRAHIINRSDNFKDVYKKRKHLFNWAKMFSFETSKSGFVAADGLFEHLFSEIIDKDFSDLSIPFFAIATDYNNGEAVALSSGSLYTAVRASMAVPGVFAPVPHEHRLLVDGCLVNNVPTDVLQGRADVILASDVISLPTHPDPTATQIIAGAMQVMVNAATQNNFKEYPAQFIFKPDTNGIDTFDFRKITRVLQRGEEALTQSLSELEQLI